MAPGDDQIDPSSKEPENKEWLINIMNGKDPQTRPKPLIQKAARTLREIKSNQTCFDPMVVSFGPYHHGDQRLRPMERYKEVAARWFFFRSAGNEPPVLYDKFVAATRKPSPRDCYYDKFEDEYNQENLTRMMFLDGCFILHFIDLVVKRPENLSQSGLVNEPLIVRDMFLLENQIPYSILKVLMSLMPESTEGNPIEKFIEMVSPLQHESPPSSKHLADAINLLKEIFPKHKKSKESTCGKSSSAADKEDSEPFHLLDFLRSKLIDKGIVQNGVVKMGAGPSPSNCSYWNYYFRSIMELKTKGIKLRRSTSKSLKDIEFKKGLIHGHLQLPQLMVDDATKTRLLNLIAYEMCPDGLSDRTVTSYICFLDSLIDHAEDVKELRSKNILLNRLGSDVEVANLFNELANNLTPNNNIYADVMKQIEEHSHNHVKVWIGEVMHTHFSSPWTAIALLAAVFVIILTLLQTIYSARS